MDLCGEPEFYDHCLLNWHAAAVDQGCLVVHAAAWDSVPADVGVLLASRKARSQGLTAVQAEVAHRFSGVEAAHATTWEAAVHGFASASSGGLGRLRREVADKFPPPEPLVKHLAALSEALEAPKKRATARKGAGASVAAGPQASPPPQPRKGWFGWDPRHGAYAVKFPGSDASVRQHARALLRLRHFSE
jgi:hypothetical protein